MAIERTKIIGDDFESYADDTALIAVWTRTSYGNNTLITGDADFGQAMRIHQGRSNNASSCYLQGDPTYTRDGQVIVQSKMVYPSTHSAKIGVYGRSTSVAASTNSVGSVRAWIDAPSQSFNLSNSDDSEVESVSISISSGEIFGIVLEIIEDVATAVLYGSDFDVDIATGVYSGTKLQTLEVEDTSEQLRGWGVIQGDTNNTFYYGVFGKIYIESYEIVTFAPVRQTYAETVGSLLDTVSLVPSQATISEAFFADISLSLTEIKDFYHFLRPSQPIAKYYPRPTNNEEMLSTYRAETKLARMDLAYPAPMLVLASDTSYGTATITPQQAITEIFTAWSNEFPWFTFEPVPDLRVHTVDGVYTGSSGLLSLGAIIIPQEEPRRSMRQILNEFLDIFAGTIVRQNKDGNIELIPAVGSDAPTITKTLSWSDIRKGGLTDGKADPTGVFNAASGSATFVEKEDDFFVMEPSWFVFRDPDYFDDDSTQWFPEPSSRETLNLALDRASTQGRTLKSWTIVDETLITGSNISFTHPDTSADLISANIRWHRVAQGDYGEEALTASSLTSLPLDGNFHKVCHFTKEFIYASISLSQFYLAVYMRYNSADNVVEVEIRDFKTEASPYNEFLTVYSFVSHCMFEIYIEGAASVFKVSEKSVKASFGLDSTDVIPNAASSDIIAASQAYFGRREAKLSSSIFPVTSEQLAQILRGYVLANIEPRLTREITLSNWRGVTIEPDDIGHPVQIPNGELGKIQLYRLGTTHQTESNLLDAIEFTRVDVSNDTITLPPVDGDDCYRHMETGDIRLTESGEFRELENCIVPEPDPTPPDPSDTSPDAPTEPVAGFDHTVNSLAALAALSPTAGQSIYVTAGTDSSSIKYNQGQRISFQGTSSQRITVVFDDDFIVSGEGIGVGSEARINIDNCQYVDFFGGRCRDMPDYGFFLTNNDNCTFTDFYSMRSYLTGMFFYDGNTNINVYSSEVYGSYQGGDADGIACSREGNNNIEFFDCIAAYNSDDGFDKWRSTNIRYTRCRSYNNGVSYSGSRGDGNAYKLGSYQTLGAGGSSCTDCKAWANVANGFDYNGADEVVTLTNCVGWDNGGANFVLNAASSTANCDSSEGGISDQTLGSSGSGITQRDESEFISLDPANANFLEV